MSQKPEFALGVLDEPPLFAEFMTVVPSPPDERDWVAEEILVATEYPESLDLRPKLQSIRNQGRQGSCAAQTAACMKEYQERRDVHFDAYMSPQFIYNNRVNQNSEGMYGRDVMRIMSKIGSLPEKYYEYGRIEKKEAINQPLYDIAKNYIIQGYAKVFTIPALKRALNESGPCYIAFPVYNFGFHFWKPQFPGQKRVGGHALTVVGYHKTHGFLLRNSWGKMWGEIGYTYFPYSHWGMQYEIWTTVDKDSLPKPEDLENGDNDNNNDHDPNDDGIPDEFDDDNGNNPRPKPNPNPKKYRCHRAILECIANMKNRAKDKDEQNKDEQNQ